MTKRLLIGLFALIDIANADCMKINSNDYAGHYVLSGYVINEKEWGPPNFGDDPQTDSKFTATLLKLDHPLTFCDPSDAKYYQTNVIDCIQMMDRSPSTYKWQHVTVTGDLYAAETPAEVTPVTINNDSLTRDNMGPLSPADLTALQTYHCKATVWTGFKVSNQGAG